MTDSTGLVLVKPRWTPPPPLDGPQPADWPEPGTLVAIDFETRGTNPAADPDFWPVGVGLAWGSNYETIYHPISMCTDLPALVSRLASYRLVAHNVVFDAAVLHWLFRRAGLTPEWPWEACTFGLYRQFATEGHPGQRWGLKTAQSDLLKWEETNEIELDEWLINTGYGRPGHPTKSEMWRAPIDILGRYCRLDAAACLQLYDHVFSPLLTRFPQMTSYHHREFMTLNKLIISQLFSGVSINQQALSAYNDSLIYEIGLASDLFRNHADIKTHLNTYNLQVVDSYERKQPARLKKNGEVSKIWTKWRDKLEALKRADHFNLNSNKQLQWLFYERLRHPVKLRTKANQPSVDTNALGLFGEPGMLLRSYNELTKEQGYVEKLIGHYVFHPQYKNPGTITGRLAGAGGVNIQQIPKERGYMQCWRARPGCVWIHSDVTSLEQVVMAELSGDETLMRLYGPNANPNHDVYLFTGCYIKGLQSAIRRYYDPDDPTPEGKRLAKQHCAKQRAIAKKLVLSSSYGAGPRRIHQDLQLQGVSVTLDDVFSMHRSYWQLYSGVAEYGEKLNTEWTERGGWVYNGLGRPMTASPDKTKDLVNTVCQSTGHDILMILLYYTSTRLDALGIEYRWIIPDWHDEYILEIEEKHVDKTVPECEAAYADLNNELAGTIPITGDVDVVTNLWEAKTA